MTAHQALRLCAIIFTSLGRRHIHRLDELLDHLPMPIRPYLFDVDHQRGPILYVTPVSLLFEFKLLLDSGGVNPDSKYKDQTPLSCAAKRRHEAVVKLLLDSGKFDVDSKYNDPIPLLPASEDGYEAVVQLLLDSGKVDYRLEE